MAFFNYFSKQTGKKRPIGLVKKEIGDYILGKTIGRGASGRVKVGIHQQTGEKVAIKMISRIQLSASSSTSRAVQRELAILQLLHHPHLVDLRQVLQDSNYVYFVMEYLEGGELFHYLAEQGRLEESKARHLFSQLISALHWCHAHHISHRDLKPENILLDKDRVHLKIADFGMAALQPLNVLLKTSCGSPHYASPEIVKGKKYDGPLTDVWSCGVILYAMVTGRLPFDDEQMGRLLAKIKRGKYRPLPGYVSQDLQDLIQRMLVIDPHQRLTIAEISTHPWLANPSFVGTDLRFLQPNKEHATLYPLYHPDLHTPMHLSDLEGRVWETLKVLFRDYSEQDLVRSLAAPSGNIQKLTCKLLKERSWRLKNNSEQRSASLPIRRSSVVTEEIPMTPPLRQGSVDSLVGSLDTASYFPPTPQSTSLFQLETACTLPKDRIALKGEPADPLMTVASPPAGRSPPVWSLAPMASPSAGWWEKAWGWIQPVSKSLLIECRAKDPSEAASKLHQLLAECFTGQLQGRLNPPYRIDWYGTLVFQNVVFEFKSHFYPAHDKVKINLLFQKGTLALFSSALQALVHCLNTYENESAWLIQTHHWHSSSHQKQTLYHLSCV
ncbi:kinase-like domain-containing protein [Sporodiniella umbellata]|nr:kinase-like domain-containing protein [Sporodiniella umbellata]